MFANTRLQVQWQDTASHSVVEAPTIRVNDAFTSGGAQIAGGRHPRDVEFASDLDYIRGIHTVRAGTLIDSGSFRADDSTNYLGTYTFTSLAAFNAGQPATYTRRIGNPLIEYWNTQAAAYIQDDIRVKQEPDAQPGRALRSADAPARSRQRRPAVRHQLGAVQERQDHAARELRPLLQLAQREHLRADAAGRRLPPAGARHREPRFSRRRFRRHRAADQSVSPRQRRADGADAAAQRRRRSDALAEDAAERHLQQHARLESAARSQPERAPERRSARSDVRQRHRRRVRRGAAHAADRDDAQRESGAGTRVESAAVELAPHDRAVPLLARQAENNTDGAFTVPPSGTLATEWGPTGGDRRHRVSASINSQALKNLNASLTLAGNSGTPYTITTGVDNNGDLIFNDRPAGVGRNTVRTPWQLTWSSNLSYSIAFGTPAISRIQERGGGGDRGDRNAGPTTGRYRLVFTLQAQNLTNRANYVGFSGVMTSPFFEQATAVANPRKIDFGMSFRF